MTTQTTYTLTKEQHPIFHLAGIRYDRNTGRYKTSKYSVADVELWHNMNDDMEAVRCQKFRGKPQPRAFPKHPQRRNLCGHLLLPSAGVSI